MNDKTEIRLVASEESQRFCQDRDGLIFQVAASATVRESIEARIDAQAMFVAACRAAAMVQR